MTLCSSKHTSKHWISNVKDVEQSWRNDERSWKKDSDSIIKKKKNNMCCATNVSNWLRTNMKIYFRISKSMLKHQRDRLKSRHKTTSDIIHCEIPDCPNIATEIHHISRCMRWKRTNKSDGSDLIALCRFHHEEIHAKNTEENIEILLEIVKKILIRKSRFYS